MDAFSHLRERISPNSFTSGMPGGGMLGHGGGSGHSGSGYVQLGQPPMMPRQRIASQNGTSRLQFEGGVGGGAPGMFSASSYSPYQGEHRTAEAARIAAEAHTTHSHRLSQVRGL